MSKEKRLERGFRLAQHSTVEEMLVKVGWGVCERGGGGGGRGEKGRGGGGGGGGGGAGWGVPW